MEDLKNYLNELIWTLVKDNDYISEIETNGPGYLFYKERGQRKIMSVPLLDTEEKYNIAMNGLIEKAHLKTKPFVVEGRYTLRDGRFGRLHIAMPPSSPYPAMTLALKSTQLKNLTAIQSAGSFNTEISVFLKALIGAKLTTIVSGGTGAGKTTLLEALTGEFNPDDRIGVAEDSPELLLNSLNTVYMNSTVKAPGMEEKDVASLEWVVQQLNRMRIDSIIIGETRGKEFFDFIIAASAGKPGSLTTIHADDGQSALRKMTTFMSMATTLPPRTINEMISDAVDIIVQLGTDKKTKGHRIISIDEVTNSISSGPSPTIALNPLFVYDQETRKWRKHFATDALKKKLENAGYDGNTYKKFKEEEVYEHSSGLPSYFKK